MAGEFNTVILSGGVGGAKFVDGYARSPFGQGMSVIGNIADDEEFHGLWVSPDIDTLTYVLAGIEGPQGWGVNGDTLNALDVLGTLGAPNWMTLGDRDLGLHIYRTNERRQGRRPFEIAQSIAQSFGIEVPILLPTDAVVQTRVHTDRGSLSFQEYMVREQTRPGIRAITFNGAQSAPATPEALAAIAAADVLIIAPSNPIVSVGPILAVRELERAVRGSKALKIGVSPLIGGKAVKGPAVAMLMAAGLRPDVLGVLEAYRDFLDAFVIDRQDANLKSDLSVGGVTVHCDDILMRDRHDRVRLAESVGALAQQLLGREAA